MNADGWGVGWWDPHVRSDPARYRTASPMWTDRSFRSVAEVVHAGALVAAVRSATPPSPIVDTGNAPFTAGPWLFSLNGFVSAYRGPIGEALRRLVSEDRAIAIEGTSDSEVLFALVLDQLDDGAHARGGARHGDRRGGREPRRGPPQPAALRRAHDLRHDLRQLAVHAAGRRPRHRRRAGVLRTARRPRRLDPRRRAVQPCGPRAPSSTSRPSRPMEDPDDRHPHRRSLHHRRAAHRGRSRRGPAP